MSIASIFILLVAFAIIALPVMIVASWFRTGPVLFCADCGTEGKAKLQAQGSFLVEVFLWLMLIVPGLIYSLWRMSSKRKICPRCESQHLIPADSPMARKLRADLAPKIAA